MKIIFPLVAVVGSIAIVAVGLFVISIPLLTSEEFASALHDPNFNLHFFANWLIVSLAGIFGGGLALIKNSFWLRSRIRTI